MLAGTRVLANMGVGCLELLSGCSPVHRCSNQPRLSRQNTYCRRDRVRTQQWILAATRVLAYIVVGCKCLQTWVWDAWSCSQGALRCAVATTNLRFPQQGTFPHPTFYVSHQYPNLIRQNSTRCSRSLSAINLEMCIR